MTAGASQYLSSSASTEIDIAVGVHLQVLQWMAFATNTMVGLGASSVLSDNHRSSIRDLDEEKATGGGRPIPAPGSGGLPQFRLSRSIILSAF